jgi:hypothetical protein
MSNPLNNLVNSIYLYAPYEANQTFVEALLAANPKIESEGRITYTHRRHESDIPPKDMTDDFIFFGEKYVCLETFSGEITPDSVRNVVGLMSYYPYEVNEARNFFY